MEEKKNPGQKKLSYEELAKSFGELHLSYQKLYAEYEKAVEVIKNREFDYTSFFLSMLFKVMDHPEMYNVEFVNWASKCIEDALRSFDEMMIHSLSKTDGRGNQDGAE